MTYVWADIYEIEGEEHPPENPNSGAFTECVLRDSYDTLKTRLTALELAGSDVYEAMQAALDTPEDADLKQIRKLLEVMGELIPAQRPTVRELGVTNG